jgi:hypothetical protein
MKALFLSLLSVSIVACHSAIWEFDVGGVMGPGLLGGNEIDSLPNSPASGREVGHNEIPGILYDDVQKTLEFHVGWGVHEVTQGVQLAGQYISSALYGPAAIDQNASRGPLYSFDTSNGYMPANDPTGRTGFVHARVQLVDLQGYSVAQQQADLLSSLWYFNIISTAYETGEIRGQLLNLSSVPEPRHYALLSGGALLAFAAVRNKLRNRP